MTDVTAEKLAAKVREPLTKLYVLYFRRSIASDLSGPQLTILTRLAEMGPMRISKIADLEDIRMPTASNALHQLEQLKLVERDRDTKDRRGVQVHITDHGRAELDRVNRERETEMTHLLSMLSPEELEAADKLADIITVLSKKYDHWKDSESSGDAQSN